MLNGEKRLVCLPPITLPAAQRHQHVWAAISAALGDELVIWHHMIW